MEISFCHTKTWYRNLIVKTVSFMIICNIHELIFNYLLVSPHQLFSSGWIIIPDIGIVLELGNDCRHDPSQDIAHLYSDTIYHGQGFQYLLTRHNQSIWFCLSNQFLHEDNICLNLDISWVTCLSFSRLILF